MNHRIRSVEFISRMCNICFYERRHNRNRRKRLTAKDVSDVTKKGAGLFFCGIKAKYENVTDLYECGSLASLLSSAYESLGPKCHSGY